MKLKEAIFQASLKYHYGQVVKDLNKPRREEYQPNRTRNRSQKAWDEKPKIDV